MRTKNGLSLFSVTASESCRFSIALKYRNIPAEPRVDLVSKSLILPGLNDSRFLIIRKEVTIAAISALEKIFSSTGTALWRVFMKTGTRERNKEAKDMEIMAL